MKRFALVVPVILAIVLLTPGVALASSLGVSPSRVNLDLRDGKCVVGFNIHYYEGPINISVIGLPVSVAPSRVVVGKSSQGVSLSFESLVDEGQYQGYIKFSGSSEGSVALAVNVLATATVSLSATTVAPGLPGGGGGNGGGASTGYTVESSDGLVSLNIPEGTVVRNTSGNVFPAYYVQTTALAESPPPPAGSNIIGLAYDFQPAGATFSPPITLTFALPEEVADSDLTLAFYDAAIGEWVLLDSVVNPEAGTITASVSHFTAFAVLVTLPRTVEPTPVPAPTPIVPEPVILGPAPATPEPAPPAPEPVASELTLEPVTPEPVGLPVEPEVAGWVWALMSIGVLVLASSLVWWRLRRRKP